ncbi:MAG: hypothetical protein AUH25_04160 [Thaumarchaeota archaeon 13_1_40CM_38_12]|nr:MAG: hypothetical protein AUH25_04160 [Thaumarchaeota archaeon 13_1_40CM_38_12]OLC34372.1 MAG: hypothetical protein AUH84_05070 [Thaumarchaeota archaeon 13_1_40CM_4_38_7]OLC94343.1 MAG: hypothetical protein AUI92_00980 [Thaumarchaeota archaeon 13_1_40CM_3_38_6]OLD28670.1 MAG: hypothetical protein AUI62_03980 [Thaumarchaeota archaeon 13_1_40CM_2_39_7]TLY08485.1 MAG: hypothetical protein E6K83_02910 [Nitrososphaerota archaeon]
MFGSKGWKEGEYVFTSKPNGEYRDIVVGIVTGVEDTKIGVNGMTINPAGLKNKISQGKAGPQSIEILKNPTPKECILALIYRVEYDNFTGVFDVNIDPVVKIHKNIHNIITGWIRESIPELINNVLSLPDGPEKDQAKRILKQRMDTLYDKDLKKYMYSICRGLKILN